MILPSSITVPIVSLAIVSFSAEAAAATRYANVGLRTGANDGSSWVNAYRSADAIAVALAASVSGDEIWVAQGVYKPTLTTNRAIAITLKSGVAVYGGFIGNEATRDQRNSAVNVTTVTGDLLSNDSGALNMTDNSNHVFVGSGAAATAILDGFRIVGGFANGATASNLDKGGGLIIVNSGSPTIRSCAFVGNRCTFGGGAVYIFTAGGTFADCWFENNVGGSFGGAFDMNNVVGTFDRCVFIGNTAGRAGACESYGSSQTRYTNCVFSGNSATGANGGGALWIGVSSAVTARNSTFVANSATSLAGCIINTSGTSTIANCILWANTGPGGTTAANQLTNAGGVTSVAYSIAQGTLVGTANLATDPLFVNQAARDFRLQPNSPAIDSGANASVPAGTTVDLANNPRFFDDLAVANTGTGTGAIVDRGAYERQEPSATPCPADINSSGSVDALDLATLLNNWNSVGTGDLNNDGGVDAQDLAILLNAWGRCAP